MIPTHCEPSRRVVAMAASVGGLNALSVILAALPADFKAVITIVMHVSPDHKSLLAEILKCRTQLQVKQAEPGDLLCDSGVFVAPPNHHLTVINGGILALSSSSAEKIAAKLIELVGYGDVVESEGRIKLRMPMRVVGLSIG